MAFRLLVKNIANNYSTGDVISVCGDDHVFGKYESKTQFINAGLNTEDWPRQFVIVNVVDADSEDYIYLLEDNSNDERRYYLQQQTEESPFYPQLLEFAEVTINKAILESLIIDRGA